MKKAIVILIVLFLSQVVMALSATEVYEEWVKHYDSVQSFKLDYDVNYTKPFHGAVLINHMSFAFNEGKYNWSYDYNQAGEARSYTTTFNGLIQKQLYLPKNNGIINEATKEREMEVVPRDYYCQNVLLKSLLRDQRPSYHLLFLLEEPEELGTKSIKIGTEDINCIGFKFSRTGEKVAGGSWSRTKEAWFAVDKNMTLVKYIHSENDVLRQKVEVTELGSDVSDPNFIYPKRAETFLRISDDEISEKAEIWLEFNVLRFIKNPVYETNTFDLQFPAECMVLDKRTGQSYINKLKQKG